MAFEGSYVWQLRQVWGSKLLVGVGAQVIVTNHRGQILLGTRTDFNTWASFGGHVDPKENITDCALRELYEEAGLKLRAEQLTPIGILSEFEKVMTTYPNGDQLHGLGLVFTAMCEDEAQAMDGEYDQFKWFDLDNLPENMQLFSKSAVGLYRKWLATQKFQVE